MLPAGAALFRGLPHQRSESVDCQGSVDTLFTSWCAECGLPTGTRTQRMAVRGRLSAKRSVRAVFVRGARPVRERVFGSKPGYLPGYETVLVSEDVFDVLATHAPEVRGAFIPGPVGHWELVGPRLEVMGYDSPAVLERVVLACPDCRQLFREPREFLTVAVTAEERAESRAFVTGFANRVQLFIDPEGYRRAGWSAKSTDRAFSLAASECFDLREIAQPFVPVLPFGPAP